MIDFHTHILPEIDDGSHDVYESISMLKQSYAQGVDILCLTSHFRKGEHNIKTWLRDREDRLYRIRETLTDEDRKVVPKVILGAEIEYNSKMNHWDYLDQLCIRGTKYLLTEMPFIPWSEAVVKTIDDIARNTDMTPIIPHIDRYFDNFTPHKYIERLYTMPVIIQMNGIYITNVNNIQFFKPLFMERKIQILGSDCHGPEWRTPNLGPTVEMLREVCGQEIVDEIEARSRKMIEGAEIITL